MQQLTPKSKARQAKPELTAASPHATAATCVTAHKPWKNGLMNAGGCLRTVCAENNKGKRNAKSNSECASQSLKESTVYSVRVVLKPASRPTRTVNDVTVFDSTVLRRERGRRDVSIYRRRMELERAATITDRTPSGKNQLWQQSTHNTAESKPAKITQRRTMTTVLNSAAFRARSSAGVARANMFSGERSSASSIRMPAVRLAEPRTAASIA